MTKKKYDILLWDLDGTLLSFLEAERYALRSSLATFGIEMTEELRAMYSDINTQHWLRLELGQITKEQLLIGRFETFFKEAGITGITPEEMQAIYTVELGKKIVYLDRADELVEKLHKEGYRQYLITNGVLKTQQQKMKNSVFSRFIEEMFVSGVIGYEKPRIEFFQEVQRQIPGFEKSRALIIGDSLTSDIRGALDFGVDCVWYNPGGYRNESPYRPTYMIGNLWELFDVIEEK